MKKVLKNIGQMILCGLIGISFNSIDCNAIQNDIQTSSSSFQDFNSLRYVGYQPSSSEENNTSRMEYSTATTEEYPSSYDMRELGLVSGTDYQGNFGTCWAFSSIESALSGILDKNPFANFSEWHLNYFTYSGDDAIEMYDKNVERNIFKLGGNSSFATATLSKWIGFTSEDLVPYNSTLTVDEDLKFNSEYHLTDAYCFNSSFSNSVATAYDINDIKSMILNGNSVMINMYYDKSTDYYDMENNSYYCYDTSKMVNHGVTVVGWDDNFNSFDNLANKPKSKGAWLVKNSWGYSFGNYGYFWISYETLPIIDATAFIVSSNENYANNYYLDDYGWTTSINSLNESNSRFSNSKYYDYASNIFTSKANEDICAVSMYTTDYNTEYTISIYTDLNENNPIGTLQSEISGVQKYMGYHTVPLDIPVYVKEGEKYSVVIKFKNPSYKNTIAIESAISFCFVENHVVDVYSYNVTANNILDHTEYGESYISNDGKTWLDTKSITGIMSSNSSDFSYGYSPDFDVSTLKDGNYAISVLGNVCIKAFTNPHDKVYFSQYGGNLYNGETIELSNPNSDTIYYTLDGSTPNIDSLIYSEPITFNGKDLTISARVLSNGVLGDVYTETFTQNKAVLSTLCIKQSNGETDTFTELEISKDNQPCTELSLNCDKDIQSINLYAISTGDISINNDSIISGHESDNINIHDGMTIPITVSKNGSITTNYTLTIHTSQSKPDEKTFSPIDLLLAKKYILGMKSINKEQVLYLDFNTDNIIDILDILYLKNTLLK